MYRQLVTGNSLSTGKMMLTSQREVKKCGIEKSEVEDGEMGGSELKKSETEKTERAQSDHFEDCN